MFTQVGEKQLTDFLRTVTAASDLVDCTLVNCGYAGNNKFQDLINAPRKLSPMSVFSKGMLIFQSLVVYAKHM